jgi:CRISPR associated protein Cas1
MKPLYLNGAASLRVLLDGPGLRIRAPGSADRLFPLRLLSRVIVCGRVEWTMDALLACAQAGIPVTFLRRDGELRARVFGAAPRKDWLRLDALLVEFLGLHDGVNRYRDWVHAQAQQSRRELVYDADRGPWHTERSALAQRLDSHARRYARSADLRRFDAQVRALVRIRIETQVIELGIDPNTVDLLINEIMLIDDLTSVLIWSVQNARLAWIKHASNRQRRLYGGFPSLGWKQAISFVESQDSALRSQFLNLMRKLQLFLLDGVQSHGVQ